jgi:arabinofuranosyltransferase
VRAEPGGAPAGPGEALARGRLRAAGPLALAGLGAALLGLAWANRFVQDDAYIAFRYARHLAEGLGPVFNAGERVEGYTSALWVLLLAGALRAGADPVAASVALGLAAFLGSLLLTYRLARSLGLSPAGAATAVLVLGTNYSFSAYATGGLETSLQACLATAALALLAASEAAGRWSGRRLLALSLVGAAALLTRLDAAVLLAPAGALALADAARGAGRGGERARRLALLLAPGGAIVGGWFAWKLAYYGAVLPNTFHAKVDGVPPLVAGGYYLALFLMTYGLAPAVALAAGAPWPARRRTRLALWATLALWAAYVVWVGGDFMEFRLWVPVLPLLLVLVVGAVWTLAHRPLWRVLVPAALVACSAFHAVTQDLPHLVEPVRDLGAHVGRHWGPAGRALRRAFPDGGVRIATTAAGALPYLSRLETVDMLGLNDAWVARHGRPHRGRPGHQRLAPLAYLQRRHVHLLIGNPAVVAGDEPPFTREEWAGVLFGELIYEAPPGARFVEIPLEDGRKLVVVQLEPNAAVERAVRRHGWRAYPIRARGAA